MDVMDAMYDDNDDVDELQREVEATKGQVGAFRSQKAARNAAPKKRGAPSGAPRPPRAPSVRAVPAAPVVVSTDDIRLVGSTGFTFCRSGVTVSCGESTDTGRKRPAGRSPDTASDESRIAPDGRDGIREVICDS